MISSWIASENISADEIDPALNELHGEEVDISTKESKVRVLVIPTDEELMIARDVERLRG